MYTHNHISNRRTISSCIPFILILISIQSVFFVPLYYNLISSSMNTIYDTENINITITSSHKYEYLISHNDNYISQYTYKLYYNYNIDIQYPIYFTWISHNITGSNINGYTIYIILDIKDKSYKYTIDPTIYTSLTINRIVTRYNDIYLFNTIHSYKNNNKYGLSISLNHV